MSVCTQCGAFPGEYCGRLTGTIAYEQCGIRRGETKTVHVCIARGNGQVIADVRGSTRDSAMAVIDVPLDVTISAVILKISKLVFLPWPASVSWPVVARLSQGSIVREVTP